jgi:hypothetical protein
MKKKKKKKSWNEGRGELWKEMVWDNRALGEDLSEESGHSEHSKEVDHPFEFHPFTTGKKKRERK